MFRAVARYKDHLPEVERHLLVERYLRGVPLTVIAVDLGMSRRAAFTRLNEATRCVVALCMHASGLDNAALLN